MPSHRLLTLLVALALLATGTACGKQPTTSARLRDDTAAVVRALNAKNAAAAKHSLDILDMDLAAAGRLNQLDSATVTALRAGVTKLRADLALITPKPVVVVTPTQQVTTPPRPGHGDHHHKKEGD